MTQTETLNRRIVLAQRPTGALDPKRDFRLEETPVPTPGDGQILLRTLYLSLDPYMRGRMSSAESYAKPVEVGGVMEGGTVCRVVSSNHPKFQSGDLVLGLAGWQDYAISDGVGLGKLDPAMANPSYALGVLGMPGYTAYMGLLDIGAPKPGETVVVAAATGAVGSVVGQIAKLKGCRVVGIAGGAEKCSYAVENLGFDACVDHRAADLPARLGAACPAGIDVYFENVGGAVFDAVLPLLNANARVPLCGLISRYNADDKQVAADADRSAALFTRLLVKRIKIQGFIIFLDYPTQFKQFRTEMSQWLNDGKIRYREDIVDGLEHAPDAFMGLLNGKNFGKLVIRVAGD